MTVALLALSCGHEFIIGNEWFLGSNTATTFSSPRQFVPWLITRLLYFTRI